MLLQNAGVIVPQPSKRGIEFLETELVAYGVTARQEIANLFIQPSGGIALLARGKNVSPRPSALGEK